MIDCLLRLDREEGSFSPQKNVGFLYPMAEMRIHAREREAQ